MNVFHTHIIDIPSFIKNINYNKYSIDSLNYFDFLDNENNNEIFKKLMINKTDFNLSKILKNEYYINDIKFQIQDFQTLTSILILKSFERVSMANPIKLKYFFNSDFILSEVLTNFNKFLIFNFNEVLNNEFLFKRELFRYIKMLTIFKIIDEEILTKNNKTMIY
jgi:hypothetical protein